MGDDDGVSTEEAYGERIPYAYDIEALAAMVEADTKRTVLSEDTRDKIDDVVATFCKQFRSTDND